MPLPNTRTGRDPQRRVRYSVITSTGVETTIRIVGSALSIASATVSTTARFSSSRSSRVDRAGVGPGREHGNVGRPDLLQRRSLDDALGQQRRRMLEVECLSPGPVAGAVVEGEPRREAEPEQRSGAGHTDLAAAEDGYGRHRSRPYPEALRHHPTPPARVGCQPRAARVPRARATKALALPPLSIDSLRDWNLVPRPRAGPGRCAEDVRCRRVGAMERAIPLRLEDRAILDLEGPTIAGHTCKVVVVEKGEPDADALRAEIASRIAGVPQLTWRLGESRARSSLDRRSRVRPEEPRDRAGG